MNAAPSRIGPRAVPLHLNGVEIGVVKEPSQRGVEEQAFEALCSFAVDLLGPLFADPSRSVTSHRRRCAEFLLATLGVDDPQSPAVLLNLRQERRPDGSLVRACWRFAEPAAGHLETSPLMEHR